MVSRLRERQYQLAAQKHNEAFLKYDYYQQTAKYFERESRIARHYDSWNVKDLEFEGQREKAKKAERLLVRRNKLRNVLKEDEENYTKELEELKATKTRTQEPSLEVLREQLKERKAEQALYYPKTCRRFQTYFLSPSGSASTHWTKDSFRDSSRVCRDSTNTDRRIGTLGSARSMSTDENAISLKGQENVEQELSRCSSSQYSEERRPNPKFLARYARRSLENTNVRNEEGEEYKLPRRANRFSLPMESHGEKYNSFNNGNAAHDSDKNRYGDEATDDFRNSAIGNRADSIDRLVHQENSEKQDAGLSQDNGDKGSVKSIERNSEERRPQSESEKIQQAESEKIREAEKLIEQEEIDEVDRCIATDVLKKKNKADDNREFESEKSLPWLRMDPTDKNLSKQMFLYLTHKELKCKIEDLSKRESHACIKQSWDEALRLRDMRNRLELIREKRLYNTDDLLLDEEVRKIGLKNIDKREEELAEREHACMDSTMYSEDAKILWKKWVREDDKSVIKDARDQRETLMNSLEKEWQGLAIRDKDMISQSFQNVMSGSALQDEHKLTAAISAARMKSLSTPTK